MNVFMRAGPPRTLLCRRRGELGWRPWIWGTYNDCLRCSWSGYSSACCCTDSDVIAYNSSSSSLLKEFIILVMDLLLSGFLRLDCWKKWPNIELRLCFFLNLVYSDQNLCMFYSVISTIELMSSKRSFVISRLSSADQNSSSREPQKHLGNPEAPEKFSPLEKLEQSADQHFCSTKKAQE